MTDHPLTYHVHLRGTLDGAWAAWFDNARVLPQPDDTTLLICQVADQAALFGLLRRVRDLGIPLISVTQIEPRQ